MELSLKLNRTTSIVFNPNTSEESNTVITLKFNVEGLKSLEKESMNESESFNFEDFKNRVGKEFDFDFKMIEFDN